MIVYIPSLTHFEHWTTSCFIS